MLELKIWLLISGVLMPILWSITRRSPLDWQVAEKLPLSQWGKGCAPNFMLRIRRSPLPTVRKASADVKQPLATGQCGSAACCAESLRLSGKKLNLKTLLFFSFWPLAGRAEPFRTAGGRATIFHISHALGPTKSGSPA